MPLTTPEFKLEEFKQFNALYASYLTLVLSTVTFALTAVTGLAAYALKDGTTSFLGVRLGLPALLCLAQGAGFLLQVGKAQALGTHLDELRKEISFGMTPHVEILVNALRGFGGLLVVVGLYLCWTIWRVTRGT